MFFLKHATESSFLISIGVLFHSLVAETAKERPPSVSLWGKMRKNLRCKPSLQSFNSSCNCQACLSRTLFTHCYINDY